MPLGTVKIMLSTTSNMWNKHIFKKQRARNSAVEHPKIPCLLWATNAWMDVLVCTVKQCSVYVTVGTAWNIFHNKAIKNQTGTSLVPLNLNHLGIFSYAVLKYTLLLTTITLHSIEYPHLTDIVFLLSVFSTSHLLLWNQLFKLHICIRSCAVCLSGLHYLNLT